MLDHLACQAFTGIQRAQNISVHTNINLVMLVGCCLIPESQGMRTSQEGSQFINSPNIQDCAFAPNPISSFKNGHDTCVTPGSEEDEIAPEQEITILAFRLAILEKLASGLGTLAFLWATVVLLGGFVANLQEYDFWVIWVLLITEGTRVFSRSHEIEWQHAASSAGFKVRVKRAGASIRRIGSNAFHRMKSALVLMIHKPANANDLHQEDEFPGHDPVPVPIRVAGLQNRDAKDVKRTWSRSTVRFLPFKLFSAQHVSFLLHLLQLASAIVTIGFSLSRLFQQDYQNVQQPLQDTNNLNYGLNLFYTLSLAEAAVFLIEKAYWEYQINWRCLLVRVTQKAGLDEELLDVIQVFLYETYSTCLKRSVLDGLDMDLVEFSIQQIMSNGVKEQLGGTLILSAFIRQDQFEEDTIRKIGTTLGVVERLLEMLTWKNRSEKEIRRAAAHILSQMVHRRSNCYRIVTSSGSLDRIISLLIDNDEDQETNEVGNGENKSESNGLKLFGLQILKNLARDHRCSLKIGSTPGLLAILISLIEVKVMISTNNMDQVNQLKIFKKTLQLLKQLVSSKGNSGKLLRWDIGRAIFTLRNLRDILEFGGSQPVLQELALDILINLALDDEIREKIGGTGGIIRNLIEIFLREETDEKMQVKMLQKAGQALTLLVLQNPKNCKRILSIERNVVKGLLDTLKNRHVKEAICAAYILRNLFPNLNQTDRAEVVNMAPFVVRTILQASGKQLESALGLAASIIPLMEEVESMFKQESEKTTLIMKIMKLTIHSSSSYVPRIRRHTVELVIALIKKDSFFLEQFRQQALESHLRALLDTVSDVENYITFSGMTGLTCYAITMEELVDVALHHLRFGRD